MNPHHFGWQVYLILDEGNRKLDELLKRTVGNLSEPTNDMHMTLERFKELMLDSTVQKELGRIALEMYSYGQGSQWAKEELGLFSAKSLPYGTIYERPVVLNKRMPTHWFENYVP